MTPMPSTAMATDVIELALAAAASRWSRPRPTGTRATPGPIQALPPQHEVEAWLAYDPLRIYRDRLLHVLR
jgi:hypothetical protein